VRNGISTFGKMSIEELQVGIDKLTKDLKNGVWQQKYGHLQQQDSYDAGYRILFVK
jgi:hypothetical protein